MPEMYWTRFHGKLFAEALENLLGDSKAGAMAFVRCLAPDVVEALVNDKTFSLAGWHIFRVSDLEDEKIRTITGDRAVELREAKDEAVLLLVDTSRVGAGMDGIYSAAKEVDEAALFEVATRKAIREIEQDLLRKNQHYAEQAVRAARRYGRRHALSRWTEFDFFCRVAAGNKMPGSYLHLLGLWPIFGGERDEFGEQLDTSRMFVDRLLGPGSSGLSPAARIESIRLDEDSKTDAGSLEKFLHEVDTKPLPVALKRLSNDESLWIGNLKTERPAQSIQGIELKPWRNEKGTILKWSGLVGGGDVDEPPAFIIRPNAEQVGRFSTLSVKWSTNPVDLERNAVDYRISVQTDQDEELAFCEVPHSARKSGELCRFTDDDFSRLDEDTQLEAKVVISVVGDDRIERKESEGFMIRFGDPPESETGGVGGRVRTFSEGLIELGSREAVSKIAAAPPVVEGSKGFVLLRTPIERGTRKSFKVFRPSLIADIDRQWARRNGELGRWSVRVRGSGDRAAAPRFEPFDSDNGEQWNRVVAASRSFAERFGCGGSIGQVYDDQDVASFRSVQEYLRAWAALLDVGDPSYALVNTVDVQSLSGRTIGLIVLPAHPLRVAWHVAYDNLVLNTAFDQNQSAKDIREEFASLDGAMFPTFLPRPGGGAYVFADTLGFHAVGMVPDTDMEPKAAVAILSRALGEGNSVGPEQMVGNNSAKVLTDEIAKYLDCHDTSRLLHVHALRAGDGHTVARALGGVDKKYRLDSEYADTDGEEEHTTSPKIFSLDLYPSDGQRDVSGRYISEALEKRRRGAGILAADDHWMLESLSLPNGINMPRLRWARKERANPIAAAHLAIAFDTFESRTVLEDVDAAGQSSISPYYSFGLLSFFERRYTNQPSPVWVSTIPDTKEGEKHPSRRAHTETLARFQDVIQSAVSRHLGVGTGHPVLKTEISREKADSLEELHRLCDWVITLDRNAGIEYFDSPRDNRDVYDAYVIDCVPEREDLGCLQLITSTAKLSEVRVLLDNALDQMGLSRSRRNAEFLLENLKALSGRLAIRLTGHRQATSELIALAVSRANCEKASTYGNCWVSLNDGFFVPVDDNSDLVPPSKGSGHGDHVGARPDLIHVSVEPRKGLVFRFIEVKYRRHLRTARSPEVLKQINQQTQDLRKRWHRWYGDENVCTSFRALRRAKLARVLRFYADKAHRHGMQSERHEALVEEIDRMIAKGGNYSFASPSTGDRGWVFCPEFASTRPLKISPEDWDTQIFMFGPALLPDSESDFEVLPLESEDKSDAGRAASWSTENGSGSVSPPTVQIEEKADGSNSFERRTESAVPTIHLGINTYTNSDVGWRLGVDGNPHLLIAGLPGMGKTTCLVDLCKQMVAANVRPLVFSYHQDIDERLKEAIGSVRFVDFDGLGFNPLRVINRSTRMAHLDVAGAVRDIFVAIYPELGDVQADRIRKAIKESFEEVGWASGEVAESDPAFRRFVEILRADPNPDRGLSTLLARLGELDDYGFFETGDESNGSLWESELPTVVRVHTTQNDNLQRAFACLVFYGLYKDMFRRGVQDRIAHALVFDEAHRAARLKLIPTMAKECRKYGISLVLASQEARDFDISVFSAVANYLIFRLTDADAKFLVRNVSSSKQERSLIDRIKQIEKFSALYFAEGRSQPAHVARKI